MLNPPVTAPMRAANSSLAEPATVMLAVELEMPRNCTSNNAPIEYHVRPRLPLPVEALDGSLPIEPPALIKGYLRLGAKVLGPPAWDPDFNSADLPMLMRIADLPPRYRKHFLGAA